MTTLTVGQGKEYSTISAAVAASHNGDVIAVDAGTYTNDYATITTNITIEGVGGMVNLVSTGDIPNGKAILVTDANVTLDHLSFSGATVADGNGAGVRYETGNLTITNCYFHDNQDGLLAAANPTGTISIDHSEFAHNGTGDGYTHGLYVGEIADLTVTNSYFHDTVVGNQIKSRADNTVIENNRIIDGTNGTASYDIDLPDGGKALISGNVIQQSATSQNPAIIHFGGEGGPYAGSSLTIENNTILNDLAGGTALLNQTSITATMDHNQLYNVTHVASGPVSESADTILTTEPAIDTSHPWQAATTSTTTTTPTSTTSTTPTSTTTTTTGTSSSSPTTTTSPTTAPSTTTTSTTPSTTGSGTTTVTDQGHHYQHTWHWHWFG